MKKSSKFNSVLASVLLMLISFSCKKENIADTSSTLDDKAVSSNITTQTTSISATAAASIRIEAESYSAMYGVQTEACREGGQNVGYIQVGDWMDYKVNVPASGTYKANFRVAGPGGKLQLKSASGTVLATLSFPGTSSGQVYTTASTTVNLTAGQQTLRVYAVTAAWNFNWFELVGSSSSDNSGSNVTPVPVTTPPSTGNNLSSYSAFEDNSSLSSWLKEICRPSALVLSSEVARKGKYSARFEFTKSDVTNYNGYVRAEIHQNSPKDAENWYGFSNFLPADFVTDPLAEVIAQWHEIPDFSRGETWRSPPISLGIQNGRYYVKILWAAAPVNTNNTKDGEKTIDLGPVDKNKWNDWAFHIKFSYKSDGILEIYKNKQKVYSLYGPNSYNDYSYPYFKLGIYKWGWNGWASYSPESKRVLFVDEVKVGNKYSNLNEVSPQ